MVFPAVTTHKHMISGLVSNCWQTQLHDGSDLSALIEEAARRDYTFIELRQGSLGTFETAEGHIPEALRLGELPKQFPHVRFNIALSLAFLGQPIAEQDPLPDAGLRAATALAGTGAAHLRLVDLESSAVDRGLAVDNLVRLTREMERRSDGLVSVEHSRQPWDDFLTAFRSAREELGSCRDHLQICFDPCNLKISEPQRQVGSAAASLAAEEISMVHFKQSSQGQVLPELCSGDVDWQGECAALSQINYAGPALLEIAPSREFWLHSEISRDYVTQLVQHQSRSE